MTMRPALLALLLAAAACLPATSQQTPPRDPNVIARDELADPAITSRDAYAAIHYLRPRFFASRGPASFAGTGGQTQLSIEYGPLRPLSDLTTMTTSGLAEVRYLTANDAQYRFGITANSGPVIVLVYNRDAR